ncbi:MAG: hypothetical protein AAF519_17755 [Bacteroidota bacterium]
MSPGTFQALFWLLSIFSAFIALIIALIRIRHHKEQQWILVLLFASVFSSLINLVDTKNTFLIAGTFYRFAEFFILFNFYVKLTFFKTYSCKPVRLIFVNIFVVLLLVAIYHFNLTIIRPLNSLTFIFLSIGVYWQIIRELQTERIEQNPIFWINSAILFSFAGSFFLFLMRQYLIDNHYDEYPYIQSIINIMGIVKNALIAYAFTLKSPRQYKLIHYE